MADNSSQPGTSAGTSKNINNTDSGNEIACLTKNLKGSSYQQAEKIINVHGEIMKNVTINVNNSTANTSTANIDYCPAPVSTFSGRSEELTALKKLLIKHQIVALVGMGGLGKTQLSRKYVLDNEADYQYKYWLESETPEKLTNSFKKFAKKLHIDFDNIDDEVVNDVYKKIQAVPTILVFDNVEKPEHVYAYLPSRVNLPSGVTIHVLVTSRWAKWTCDKQIECFKLQPLNVSESLQIFEEIFDKSCIKTMQKEWKELAETLGYLPLALQVATSYIYKRYEHNSDLRTVLADYMKQLRDGADGLLTDPLTEYGNRSVYASMMLTLKQLENKAQTGVSNVQDNVQWKFAVTIINVVAYMAPDGIYKDDLLKLVDNHENICKLDEALAILMEYSLLNQRVGWEENTIYSVHRIIQTSIRHNQTLTGTADTYYIRVLKYALAEEYFPWHVAQYIEERASVVAEYYKDNPSPNILECLIKNKAITAMEAVLKLSTNQIQIEMKEHDLLYRTVDSEDLKMTQILCKYGADINQVCQKEGEPPLHLALRRKNIELATWLLENGAAPTQRDRLGCNALHEAIKYGNHKMVPTIIKTNKAVINETNNDGRTPLLAIDYYYNKQDILSTMLVLVESGADTTAVDKQDNTILHLGTRRACVEVVSLILQLNKDLINIKNEDDETALHVIPYGDTNIDDERILSTIRVLSASNVDLTKVDKWGNTVLHSVAKGGRAAAVSLILQLNEDLINVVNKFGETALYVIPYNNMYIDDERILSTMRVLVDSGVDITKVDIRGNTVLHSATKFACVEVVSLILQLNKDLINIKNEGGKTALHVLGNGFNYIFKYLRQERKKYARAIETARVLIMNGLSLDTRDKMGRTPLDTVKPEYKDVLFQVAEECNNQLLMLPMKRQ